MTDPSIRGIKALLLFVGIGVLVLLYVLTPQNTSQGQFWGYNNELKEGLVLIQDNTLIGSSLMPNAIQGQVLGDIVSTAKEVLTWEEQITIIWNKYPDMADLLVCIVWGESRGYQLALGDYRNGIPKAYGSFQIWKDIHGLTEDQAFDFEYSLDWTANKIKEGKGHLWTTYKNCKGQ